VGLPRRRSTHRVLRTAPIRLHHPGQLHPLQHPRRHERLLRRIGVPSGAIALGATGNLPSRCAGSRIPARAKVAEDTAARRVHRRRDRLQRRRLAPRTECRRIRISDSIGSTKLPRSRSAPRWHAAQYFRHRRPAHPPGGRAAPRERRHDDAVRRRGRADEEVVQVKTYPKPMPSTRHRRNRPGGEVRRRMGRGFAHAYPENAPQTRVCRLLLR